MMNRLKEENVFGAIYGCELVDRFLALCSKLSHLADLNISNPRRLLFV